MIAARERGSPRAAAIAAAIAVAVAGRRPAA